MKSIQSKLQSRIAIRANDIYYHERRRDAAREGIKKCKEKYPLADVSAWIVEYNSHKNVIATLVKDQELDKQIISNVYWSLASGGFVARNTAGSLSLDFVVESCHGEH